MNKPEKITHPEVPKERRFESFKDIRKDPKQEGLRADHQYAGGDPDEIIVVGDVKYTKRFTNYTENDYYDHSGPGYNYRLDHVNANWGAESWLDLQQPGSLSDLPLYELAPYIDEAKKREMKADYLQTFQSYRRDYLDDLPPQRLLPGDPDYNRYKCRYNFWNGVATRLENLIDLKIVNDPKEARKIYQALIFLRQGHPRGSEFAKKEDIDRINQILDEMIEILA